MSVVVKGDVEEGGSGVDAVVMSVVKGDVEEGDEGGSGVDVVVMSVVVKGNVEGDEGGSGVDEGGGDGSDKGIVKTERLVMIFLCIGRLRVFRPNTRAPSAHWEEMFPFLKLRCGQRVSLCSQ